MKKYGLMIVTFGASACLFYYAAWSQLDFHKNLLSSVQSSLAGQLEVEMYTLDQYNSTNVHKIDVPRIKKFLDDQIADFGLNPQQFYYLVGDKWFAKKVSSDSYELIIPSNISSLADTHKMFFGLKYAPQHGYNIDDLDTVLKNGDHQRLGRYRVEIIKALVGLKIQTIPAVIGNILGATATATVLATTLGYVQTKIDQNLAYFLQGLQVLYNQVAGMQDEEALQIDIDRYILTKIDINLLEARIAELEELVLAQKRSWTGRATAWASRMLLQSGETTYLEKRLALLKEYLKENDLELRLYQQIKEKSLLRGKKI
jgi:hypothetical protein